MNRPSGVPMRIDSKGKYYTKVVSTSRLNVVLYLRSGETIEGSVHIRPEKRLSDELNDDTPFISVTGATVSRNGQRVYEASYLAVSRQAIDWVIPAQAIGEPEESDDVNEVES